MYNIASNSIDGNVIHVDDIQADLMEMYDTERYRIALNEIEHNVIHHDDMQADIMENVSHENVWHCHQLN